VNGHGGRAREFGLGPSYGFNYDFSAATGIARPPHTNEANALLAAGGTEADGILATASSSTPCAQKASTAPRSRCS
jgi:hypothetical protein